MPHTLAAIIQAKEIGNILQKKNKFKIEYILKIYFWRQRFKHSFI